MLDKKITYNKENLNDAQYLKETLENVCLYLNEIEHIVNSKENNSAENTYRLHILERYIADISDVFKQLPMNKQENRLS